MALDLYKLHIPDDIPPGQLAGKIIKAIYTDTKQSIFPCDGPYGKDWKRAISYLNRKKKKAASDFAEKEDTDLELIHSACRSFTPTKDMIKTKVAFLEGRPFSSQSKLFDNFSDCSE